MSAVAVIAAALRALPDEQLVTAAAPWVESLFRGDAITHAAVAARVSAPAPRTSKPSKKPAKHDAKTSKAYGNKHGRAPSTIDNTERALKLLAGSAEPLRLSEIAKHLGVTGNVARQALLLLRSQGQAESSGYAAGARWRIAT